MKEAERQKRKRWRERERERERERGGKRAGSLPICPLKMCKQTGGSLSSAQLFQQRSHAGSP